MDIILKATARTELKNKVKPLRRAGILPAVLYGEKIAAQSLSVPYKDFEKAYREAGESSLVMLEVDGMPHNVLIHDIANDPIKGGFIHADFYAVRMDKAIRAKVLLEFIGESPAVKSDNGILVKIMQELEVEALPSDLPRALQADISGLAVLESRLMVADITLPRGVKIIANPEEVVAIVERPRTEEEVAALSQVPEAPVAEVKTEQELKRETKEPVDESEEKR